jgi:hypothetical protein
MVEKNLKLFFWSEFFGGISFLTPVMTLFYLHRGLGYGDLFGLLIIWVVTVFFMEVPTGAFADRFGSKISFIVGHMVFISANVLYLFAHEGWIFYVASGLSGLSFTFFSGSDQAFIYESLKQLKRENEMSKQWGRIQSARFAPAVVTILFGAYIAKDLAEQQFILLIFLGLGFNLIKFVLLSFLVPPGASESQKDKHSFAHIKKGLQNLKGNRNLMLLFTNECMVTIPTYVLIADPSLAQPFFRESGLPVVFLGVVYAMDSLFSFIALNGIRWLEERLGQKRLAYVTGIAVCASFFAAVALPPSIAKALAVFFIIKISVYVRYPVFSHIKNTYIPSESRATTLSFLSMVDSFFDIVILSTLGYLTTLGIQTVFLVCGILVFIGLLFPVRIKRNQ